MARMQLRPGASLDSFRALMTTIIANHSHATPHLASELFPSWLSRSVGSEMVPVSPRLNRFSSEPGCGRSFRLLLMHFKATWQTCMLRCWMIAADGNDEPGLFSSQAPESSVLIYCACRQVCYRQASQSYAGVLGGRLEQVSMPAAQYVVWTLGPPESRLPWFPDLASGPRNEFPLKPGLLLRSFSLRFCIGCQ